MHRRAYLSALEILLEFARDEADRRDLLALGDALEGDLIDPIKPVSRGGVSTVPFLREAFDRRFPSFTWDAGPTRSAPGRTRA